MEGQEPGPEVSAGSRVRRKPARRCRLAPSAASFAWRTARLVGRIEARGAVAQLGERRVRIAKVEGSIPFRSTIESNARALETSCFRGLRVLRGAVGQPAVQAGRSPWRGDHIARANVRLHSTADPRHEQERPTARRGRRRCARRDREPARPPARRCRQAAPGPGRSEGARRAKPSPNWQGRSGKVSWTNLQSGTGQLRGNADAVSPRAASSAARCALSRS
ncbi:hypothetical protein XFF6166_1020059 [Xanthomonas citri pv. fuscans]|nr:hypothetical protein XFF6166_1020059 [Xanthomonas citri pv. fuscans]SOO03296.1 hypothetical protein XFF6960_840048 [Xanthomonas citri pv. fuscans]SOO07351.1 hypothetical protein XFF7767_960048 [Xanthomonas citri pv. fuscans]SOO11951.1 hypothetical protein XFF6970_990060 [Xanthomonas citri pv. fuscans]SOO12289.1 hypothetical protein XFF7766_1060048 [Xanthomonas citri pv. fuscans]